MPAPPQLQTSIVVQSSVAKRQHPHLMRTVPMLGDADTTDSQQSAGNPIPVAEADRSTVSLCVGEAKCWVAQVTKLR